MKIDLRSSTLALALLGNAAFFAGPSFPLWLISGR